MLDDPVVRMILTRVEEGKSEGKDVEAVNFIPMLTRMSYSKPGAGDA